MIHTKIEETTILGKKINKLVTNIQTYDLAVDKCVLRYELRYRDPLRESPAIPDTIQISNTWEIPSDSPAGSQKPVGGRAPISSSKALRAVADLAIGAGAKAAAEPAIAARTVSFIMVAGWSSVDSGNLLLLLGDEVSRKRERRLDSSSTLNDRQTLIFRGRDNKLCLAPLNIFTLRVNCIRHIFIERARRLPP